jgi:glucose/arabinose dehydrogenase
MTHRPLLITLALVLSAGPLFAAAPECDGISGVFNVDPDLDGELTTVRLALGLTNPVFVTHAPGDNQRLFVLEQNGSIRLFKNHVLQVAPFMNISAKVACCGERGLLGLAFDPDYQSNGYFYVYYTSVASAPISLGDLVVARYQLDGGNPDVGDSTSGQVIITVPHSSQGNHNGGMIAFGDDGYLYIGTGDGGSACDPEPIPPGNAQNLSATLGKLLRIDPFGSGGLAPDCEDHGGNYTIPADNPFADGAGGDCDEIWAYGLRNPWRWSFDRVTGAIYIGDVGQNVWEEVSCAPAGSTGGENYGWVNMEGDHCPNASCGSQLPCPPAAYQAPIREYNPGGSRAVAGGNVYRGCRMADLHGTYFYADTYKTWIRTFRTAANCNITPLPDLERAVDLDPPGTPAINSIVAWGEDNRGEMYVIDYNEGELFKILPNLNIMELSGPSAAPLIFDAAGGMSWENLQAVSGHNLRFFKIYRGDARTGPFLCIHKQLSTTTAWAGDPDTPSPGDVFYYLATSQDAALNETTAGAASDGTLRVVDPDESGCPL